MLKFAVSILKTLVWVVGFEPTSSHFQGEPSGQADNIPRLCLVCLEGIEPLANHPPYFGYDFTDRKRGQDTLLIGA